MKTMLNVLSVIVKIATIFFAIIGAILTLRIIILAKPAVNHVYDVVEETGDDLDPDDEDQDNRITTEAFRRTLSDPRIKGNAFVNAVDRGIGMFASFVANL